MKQMKFGSPRANQAGFTLIEIMVVVIIISILGAIIAPNIFKRAHDARVVAAKNGIKSIETQMALYKLDNFAFPNTGEGIKALVTSPGKKTWNGPYLDNVPKDPWGAEFQYQYPGTKNPRKFDVWSFGADGQPGGEGEAQDIGNWEEG